MLIQHRDLQVLTPPCSPEARDFIAIVRLETDLSAVLPYLNAALIGAKYQPAAHALTWNDGAHEIALSAWQISVGSLEDRVEAEKVVQEIVDLINRTWEARAAITPDHTAYQRLKPMDVFDRLPKTNCKACGQPTCFSFALKLVVGQVTPDQCPFF